jgi:hypothetical protein
MDDTFVGVLFVVLFVEIPTSEFRPAHMKRVTLATIKCEYGKRSETLNMFLKMNNGVKPADLDVRWRFESQLFV